MRRSDERILAMHQGTLPRPAALKEQVLAHEEGRSCDQAALAASIVPSCKFPRGSRTW